MAIKSSFEMSLGDHIEELRTRVIHGIFFLTLSVMVTLFFQDPLMKIVVAPHAETMESIVKGRPADTRLTALEETLRDLSKIPPKTPQEKLTRQALEETVKYIKGQEEKIQKSATKLKIMKYQSGFIAYLKVCFIVGIFFGTPFLLYQIWLFAAAGLYSHEKKYILFFAPFTFIAFFAGVAFGYYVLIPLGLKYLSTFANPEIAENFISIDWYLSLFFALTIALGLIFELPLVMLFLSKIGLFDAASYLAYWKYWILISVIVGAVLTPPDPVTQVLLALPICGLYGLGVLLAYLFRSSNEENGEETEEDTEEDTEDEPSKSEDLF